MKTLLRLTLCAVLAAAGTFGLYLIERQRAEVQEVQAGLRWARQIVSQAESMELNARSAGEKDPLGWTIDYLALGVEPRLIRISRFTAEAARLQNPELFALDRKAGVLDYTRIMGLDPGKGVRIQLDLGSAGVLTSFLGTRTRAMHDLAVAGVFLLLWSFFFVFTGLFFRNSPITTNTALDEVDLAPVRPIKQPSQARRSAAERALKLFRVSVFEWAGDSRSSLTVLGTRIRDLVKQAQEVSNLARSSGNSIAAFRKSVHEGLSDVHAARSEFKEAVRIASGAEVLLSLPDSPERTRKLGLLLGRLKEIAVRNEDFALAVERIIEPWATDADLACESQKQVSEAADSLDAHVRVTKESLLDQARLLQILQKNSKEPVEQEAGAEPPEELSA